MKLSQLKKIIKEELRKVLKENAIYDGKATLQPGQKFQMTGYTTTVIKDLGDKLEVKVDLPQYKKTAQINKDIFKGAPLLPGPSSVQEAGGLMGTLGGTHPMQDPEMREKVVEPTLGPNYDAYIMFKDPQYKQMKDKYPDSATNDWKMVYRSSNAQGNAKVSPDGKVIKASILSGGGIVGAFYIKK